MRALKHTPIALAALLALGAGSAFAQPAATQLPVQRPGGAAINATVGTPANNTLTVTQTASGSNRGLVEWSSFSIGSKARVNIVQPNAQSVLVNRVVGNGNSGPSASEIYGRLSANGRVFLINPSGVVFGGAAQVNVGSLVATSLDLAPSMTASNYQRLMGGADVALSGGGGAVQVLAAADPQRPQIQVTEGGSIVLLGRDQVAQNGSIAAPGGHIHLSTGSTATLRPVGTSGFVEMLALQPGAGRVELGSQSLTVASGSAGGQVSIQGDDIRLRDGSQVLADGSTGGGRIDVGGDDTRSIVVEQGATVSADATGAGNGGSITLRAMYNNHSAGPMARVDYGVTEVYGKLRARGGLQGGDGGQVETSGATVNTRLAAADGTLLRRGVVDASARTAGGNAGTWTLDPYDITISNAAPVAVNGSFNPTGPGANVQASDLSAALDAGTSVEISTEAGGAGTQAGDITVATDTVITRSTGTAPTTLTLRANNSIFINGATLDASRAGPVNLNLFADLDGNRSGSISVTSSTLLTGGGSITMAGGTNPAAGYAQGDIRNAGVSVNGGTIDTRSTATPGPAGNVVIRGQGGTGTAVPAGVVLTGTMDVGDLSVSGLASHGPAVLLNGADIRTTNGNLVIRGIATRIDTTPTNVYGVDAPFATLQLGTGSLTIAGRGDDTFSSAGAVGMRIGTVRISADAASTGTITLAGESVLSIAPGIQAQVGSNGGLVIRSDASSNTSAPTGANVVIGALASVGPTSLELGRVGFIPTILTTGGINIRPLGVSGSGALVEQFGMPIVIRSGTSNAGPTSFAVSNNLLQSPNTDGGISAGGGVVIGSHGHTGSILVDNGALTAAQHGSASINLQNEGVGSGGINLGSGNTLGNLGLLTSGDVVQTGSLSVQNLVIRGGTAGSIGLDNAANQVNGVLAFDPPSSLVVHTAGNLTVGAATVRTFDTTNGFAPLAITSSLGGDNVLLQAGGNVAVNQSIGMAGTAGPELQIVSPGTVSFAAGATLSAGNGRWRVWAPTVVGSPSTGTATNLYGCVFGDTTACSVSGIALPTTGNQALHPNQPTLAVAANPATGYVDLSLPALTYTTTGLQNGDTAAGALAGTLGTTPTSANTFAINQGTLTSPTGYNVTFTPSTLTLRPGITRQMLQSSFQAEMASDVYGRNLDQPYICTAASVIRGTLADDKQNDPLASEWGKVRNQPQLSGCLNVTDGGSCSAF